MSFILPGYHTLDAIPRGTYGAGTLISTVLDGFAFPQDVGDPENYPVFATLTVYAMSGADATLTGQVEESDVPGPEGPWDLIDLYPTVIPAASAPQAIVPGQMYAAAVARAHGGYSVMTSLRYGQAKRYVRAVLTVAGSTPAVDLQLYLAKLERGTGAREVLKVPLGLPRPWVPGGIGTPRDVRIGYAGALP